jgi:hypothetical protein
MVTVDVGERSKSVVLHLEEPIGMVERLGQAQERHGPECRSRFWTDAERRRAGGRHQSIVPARHDRLQLNRTSSLAIAPVALSLGCLRLGSLPAVRCQAAAHIIAFVSAMQDREAAPF